MPFTGKMVVFAVGEGIVSDFANSNNIHPEATGPEWGSGITNQVKEALDAWREVLQRGLQESSKDRMWNALEALRTAYGLDFSASANLVNSAATCIHGRNADCFICSQSRFVPEIVCVAANCTQEWVDVDG